MNKVEEFLKVRELIFDYAMETKNEDLLRSTRNVFLDLNNLRNNINKMKINEIHKQIEIIEKKLCLLCVNCIEDIYMQIYEDKNKMNNLINANVEIQNDFIKAEKNKMILYLIGTIFTLAGVATIKNVLIQLPLVISSLFLIWNCQDYLFNILDAENIREPLPIIPRTRLNEIIRVNLKNKAYINAEQNIQDNLNTLEPFFINFLLNKIEILLNKIEFEPAKTRYLQVLQMELLISSLDINDMILMKKIKLLNKIEKLTDEEFAFENNQIETIIVNQKIKKRTKNLK